MVERSRGNEVNGAEDREEEMEQDEKVNEEMEKHKEVVYLSQTPKHSRACPSQQHITSCLSLHDIKPFLHSKGLSFTN